jgi:hypothetical protein
MNLVRYLVDPASIICLSQRSKPCMSKYKRVYTVKLRTAHYISYSLLDGPAMRRRAPRGAVSCGLLDNCGNSRANT